jgi:hypothetical protein
MEARLRHDFGRVRVHTDARGAESARAVQALGYTVGRDIVFGAGQYRPETNEGRKLLAHELTHTIQQEAAGPSENVTLMRQTAQSPTPSIPHLSIVAQLPAPAECSASALDPFAQQPADLQNVLRRSFQDAPGWFAQLRDQKQTWVLASIYTRLCRFGLWSFVRTVNGIKPGEREFLGLQVAGSTPSVSFTTDDARGLVTALLNTYQFCVDSPIGGSQHPGQASLREVSQSDSLHVAVGPADHFDAHIDRYAPAAGGGGGECEYGPEATAAHLGRELIPSKVRSLTHIPGLEVFPEEVESPLAKRAFPPGAEELAPTAVGITFRFGSR